MRKMHWIIMLITVMTLLSSTSEAWMRWRYRLIIGGSVSDINKSLWKYNITTQQPQLHWSAYPGTVTALAVDSAFDVYAGIDGNGYVYKYYKNSGTLITSWGTSGYCNTGQWGDEPGILSISVDTNKTCYVGARVTSEYGPGFAKIEPNGVLVPHGTWSFPLNMGEDGFASVVVSDSNIVLASGNYNCHDNYLHNVSKTICNDWCTITNYIATENWWVGNSVIRAVVLGESGKIYCGGDRYNSKTVWRRNISDGSLEGTEWSRDTGTTVKAMCYDPNLGLCVVGDRKNNGDETYTSVWVFNGASSYTADTGGNTNAVVTDGTYWYVGGERVQTGSYYNVWRFDSNLTNKNPYIYTGGTTVNSLVMYREWECCGP